MRTSVRQHLRRTASGKTDVRKHTRQLSSDQRGINDAKRDLKRSKLTLGKPFFRYGEKVQKLYEDGRLIGIAPVKEKKIKRISEDLQIASDFRFGKKFEQLTPEEKKIARQTLKDHREDMRYT